MPLCPQITNTPITVTQTGDFVVSSVLPVFGNTSDGLASTFDSIEILADGKTKVYRSASEPTGAGINDGDLWIDTNDGNKLYVRSGGVWVSAQDAGIAAASAEAAAASAAAASAVSTANAAAATAGAAQSTANTALANAATAYTAATGSLQPSANTIVNASNQITAINGTGITVYSGASATTGPRVVLNSLGLAAYGSGSSVNITGVSGNGTNVTYTASGHSFPVGRSITVSGLAPEGYNGTFVIISVVAGSTFTVANTTTATVTDSNGVAESATLAISATTGNAVFSGSITGSTIIGGTLNIGGKAIIDSTGLLTATGATITGTINAEAGYFGTPTNGFSISSTGLVGVGTGTIVGGTIQGATFNNGSGTFFVSSAGVLTATSGLIGGTSITSTALTGGLIQTSSNLNKIGMSATSESIFFNYNGSTVAHLLATTGGAGVRLHYGTTANPSGNPYPAFDLDSSGLALEGSSTYQIASTSIGNVIYGGHNSTGDITIPNSTLSTGTFSSSSTDLSPGTYLSSTGAMIARRNDQIPMFAHRYRPSPYTGTTQIEMWRGILDGNSRGSIFCSATGSPSLSIPSDYRLKENIRDFVGAVDVIKSKKLRIFNLKNDPNKTDVVGFIAHEFGNDDSELVIGQKDAVDADGNPEYQSVAFTNIIPYLVGALKEIILRVETLEQGE